MEYHQRNAREIVNELGSDMDKGLTKKAASQRLGELGENILAEEKKKTFLSLYLNQFRDFMIVILLAAAAISFTTSMLWGDKNITEPAIILAIVTLNALLGTIQELRAQRSLDALKKLSSPTATVIRDGEEIKIPQEKVVVGDIVKLKAGDIVCADCRLIKCEGLTVDESSLTGEAHQVSKCADIIHEQYTPMADLKNMVMASTSVSHGTATAIVVRTGMDTEVGKIAAMLLNTEPTDTPLQKRLAKTGQTLGISALFICGIIFIIGTVKRIPPLEMFMTSVSLAVAAIPEGLPAIVTILLALGVMKMSKHNAIIRHLPSVETLGCATVICTDKTGTLTQNKMKVSQIKAGNVPLALKLCTLCSEEGTYINATDDAILSAAADYGIDTDAYRKKHPIIAQIPFDSARKRMSVYSHNRTITKGAPEYILPLCTKVQTGNTTSVMTSSERAKILRDNKAMTNEALRVIAVAYADGGQNGKIKEKDLVFAGLIGIYDPPRPEAKRAVAAAKRAGIRTIMITGDQADTAIAVAKAVGIASDLDKAIPGTQLDNATDDQLRELVSKHNVFSRVTPHHKLRIVNALKANGEVVAMTGDGVNDAPALKGADIGCSMGISGTDVAKSASDIVLTDDNFATIVYAVKEGRGIYDNIKKTVKFLLSSNIGEILTVFFGIVWGASSPLTAIELLWVNLVTDSLPAIALGLDKPADDIMERTPLDPKKGLFSKGLWASIMFEGMMIGALALVAYGLGLVLSGNIVTARTMSFFVLAVSQLTHAFNMKSEKSVLNKSIFDNKYLVLSFILGITAQLLIVYIAPTSQLFNVCPLNTVCLLICIGLSLMPLILVEFQKKLNKRYVNKHI